MRWLRAAPRTLTHEIECLLKRHDRAIETLLEAGSIVVSGETQNSRYTAEGYVRLHQIGGAAGIDGGVIWIMGVPRPPAASLIIASRSMAALNARRT